MNNIKICLFDADGVLTLPEEFFTQFYARSRGLDPSGFEAFFKNEFPAARVGQADLKELIAKNPALWQWEGTIDELLKLWFKTEDVRNEPLIMAIQNIRSLGIPCFVATNQEQYRAQYMQETMFKDEFDGYFVSALLGLEKPNVTFYEAVLSHLQTTMPELKPENVLFVDDSEKNVSSAESVGMQVVQYRDVSQVSGLFLP